MVADLVSHEHEQANVPVERHTVLCLAVVIPLVIVVSLIAAVALVVVVAGCIVVAALVVVVVVWVGLAIAAVAVVVVILSYAKVSYDCSSRFVRKRVAINGKVNVRATCARSLGQFRGGDEIRMRRNETYSHGSAVAECVKG